MIRAGIPFRFHRTGLFVVLSCLAIGIRVGGPQYGPLAGALLLASLLLHEAGHMFAARSVGVRVHEVGLNLWGAYIKRARATRHRDEILIAAFGPLMNFLLVIAFLFVPHIGLQLAICNLAIGLLNLLPIPGSDGLRILRNLWGGIEAGVMNRALSVAGEE